jgi:hypothetical protein
MQDENRKVARFFPNRFAKDALVNSKTGLQLPNGKEFSISANTKGLQEHVVCFGASKDVYADVVPYIGGGDIDIPAQIQSLDQLKAVFEKAVGPSLGVGMFTLNVQ